MHVAKNNDNADDNQLDTIKASKSNNASIINKTMINSNDIERNNAKDKRKDAETKDNKDTSESTVSERRKRVKNNNRFKMKISDIEVHNDK